MRCVCCSLKAPDRKIAAVWVDALKDRVDYAKNPKCVAVRAGWRRCAAPPAHVSLACARWLHFLCFVYVYVCVCARCQSRWWSRKEGQ
jgi:hypothetical protein